MGSKVIRNITKVFKSASGVLFGRATAGTGRGEELTPAEVRSLLSVYTISQTDTAISTAVNALVAGAPGLLDTLDELSAALGDDANFASTVTTALAGKVDSSTLNESIDDRVAALLVAGTNISLTYNDASGTLTIASTAGGLSGTGSVDNAVLRADGTGGATLQSSAIVIDDLFTASPNNTVNFVCLKPTGGTTNVGMALVPKGSGAFSLSVPDGTATGGNARGANAVDLSTTRSAAADVASGSRAVVIGRGRATGNDAFAVQGGTASGNFSTCFGDGTSPNTSSGANSFIAGGRYNTASGTDSFVSGVSGTASFTASTATGSDCTASAYAAFAGGWYAVANRSSQRSFAGGRFATSGDAQTSELYARNITTNATQTELFLDGSTLRIVLPNDTTWMFEVFIVARRTDADNESAAYSIIGCIDRNTNAASTALVGTPTTTVIAEDNAAWNVEAVADTTNGSLSVRVTGEASKTIRWFSFIRLVEVTG